MRSNILVATDGRPGALGALRVARLLAERDGSAVEVLAVFESAELHAVDFPHAVASLPPQYLPGAIDALRARVRAQLATVGPGAADWPVTIARGAVARSIARAAVKGDAGFVLLGLRQPGGVERWLAREILLRVVHLAHVPILAVPETMAVLPSRAVVAVDFSDLCRHAADGVLRLLGAGGVLHLAHVTWTAPWETPGLAGSEWTDWEETYRRGVERRLEELAAELQPPEGVTVRTHLLSGPAGPEILRLAEEVEADLVAAGSHGAGFFGRIVMGSVSSSLVHGARCALLVAPPATAPTELGVEDLSERELMANLGTAGELALSDPSPPA